MKAFVAALCAALAGLVPACGGAPAEPADVVRLYFRTLARDPIRNADLGSAEFHASHGLSLFKQPLRAELEYQQLAWLEAQKFDWYRELAPRLPVEVTSVNREGDRAEVTTRVSFGTFSFVQRFWLSRAHANAPWRINRVAQEGVESAAKLAAFMTFPVGGTFFTPLPEP